MKMLQNFIASQLEFKLSQLAILDKSANRWHLAVISYQHRHRPLSQTIK